MEENFGRSSKKKEFHEGGNLHHQFIRKGWNEENYQEFSEKRSHRYPTANYSKQQESNMRTRHEILPRFHSKDQDLRKSFREKQRQSVPNYDDWMRDQGWVRNFDGFWERRDGRYWEKMQYYEKYREWQLEVTTVRQERGHFERGCELKAKSREMDWNRYERGYDSNEMKLPKKSVQDRASSSRENEYKSLKKSSHVTKKRSFSAVRLSEFDKCDYNSRQKDRASSNKSFKKRSLSPQSCGKLSNKRISRRDNAVRMENPTKIPEDKYSYSGGAKVGGNDSESDVENQRIRTSLNSRFSSLRPNSETPFPAVSMMNLEVTLVNQMQNDIQGRKETPLCKDSLELRLKSLEKADRYQPSLDLRLKSLDFSLEETDKYHPSEKIEESLTTDEGKETTEGSDENDESSKESESNASDSLDSLDGIKLTPGVELPNYSQDVLGEEASRQNKTNDKKIDSDMIDLNVSQDLFKAAPADAAEDQEECQAKSDNTAEDEERSQKLLEVKKCELRVANIERQISELQQLRAKL